MPDADTAYHFRRVRALSGPSWIFWWATPCSVHPHLDFKEYDIIPPEDTPYIDTIDKGKFYDMLNMLAKWSWPIPVATTKEYAAVILDLPTDDHPDTDLADDDWLFAQDVTY